MVDSRERARVVMFTLLPFAIDQLEPILREKGHKLVGIVTAPGPVSRRSDEFRKVAERARPGLDVIISNYPNRWADMIRPLRPDLIFCAGFNWKIPKSVLDVPRYGAVNLHDSLLPRNRGKNSTGWALRTGDPGYGLTIHRMTPELDDGPIMAQKEVAIGDDEDVDDVLPRFIEASLRAMGEAVDRMIDGFPGIPQEESEATYTPGAFEPEWREIDWNKPARDVFFQVRSWYGVRDVPRGAFGEIDGERVLITKAKPASGETAANGASPGSVIGRDESGMLIMCADAPLRVIEWSAVAGPGPAEG